MVKRSAAFVLLVLAALPAVGTPQEKGDGEVAVKRRNVPRAVLAAFEKMYPKAAVRGYSKERDGAMTVYEVESAERGVVRDVLFDSLGTVVVVEESIPFAQLPEGVRNSVAKAYPRGKVQRAEKLTRGGTVEFEVVIRTGRETEEIVYAPDGREIKKEND